MSEKKSQSSNDEDLKNRIMRLISTLDNDMLEMSMVLISAIA